MIKKIGLVLLALALLSPAYVHASPGVLNVDLEGTSVDVNYDAQGVEILNVELDLDFASIILEVEVTGSPGILEITFDRSFLDSSFEGADDIFIVIADGDEPDFEEIATTTQSRTLSIELPNGTEEVEIIGTQFGQPAPSAPEPPTPSVPEPPAPSVPEPSAPEEPETPSEPKTQCGPGTVLKDGVCVLEEKCGPGTILQDGECVASPTATKRDVSMSNDFIYGGGAALGIALLLIIFFAIIGRASRQKNS